RGVEVSPLVAANCGFDTVWTPFFQQNFAGQPVLTVAARTAAGVITEGGVEGSLIYALSSALRQQLVQN
ncbi:NAD(P)/FAD-dependent oxidoreductase, partial [Cryobacterium sp. RTS3]|uniref:NAD(P)/FAD-dependent oxidoreductase n=1 Tax=Cryobacterium sp. RTS3 TaxID=3048643 RepID=UPI002B23AA8D